MQSRSPKPTVDADTVSPWKALGAALRCDNAISKVRGTIGNTFARFNPP